MIQTPIKKLSGRCLCGEVRFEVPDNFRYSGFCHCSECRRFSGSAASAMAGIPRSEFHLLSGANVLRHFKKTEHTVLGFCGTCGSSLYADKPDRGMRHVRLGVLDEPPSLQPQFHAYVGSKAAWDTICDDLSQHVAGRPPV